MINKEELQISNKSYINKDFQSIYPELIEQFKKLTNVVNPEAMNESDPLIVLLKLLGFIGDKSNFNIDKNILEAYLPSATQETSVRQLLEINGYTKRYYQSATTFISLLYQGEVETGHSLYLAPFETLFTDANNTITYTLLEEINITSNQTTYEGLVTEGSPKDVLINGNATIQLSNLDENYRLYLPETMIAQNKIFVKDEGSNDWNVRGTSESGWSPVNNLNLYPPKSKKFKFGFDSNKNLPYIQFPDDIIELIDSGLNVKYFITSGASGNIARGKLTVLGSPSQDNIHYYDENATGDKYSDELVPMVDELNNQNLLRIFNYYASTNGANPETNDEAYNNYKKTIGTFETLVTPRDFANWFYTYEDLDTTYPLINNIQVSDRRIDTTFYQPVITYSEYGATTKYNYIQGAGDTTKQITPFDLVLYPLQQVSNFTFYDNNGELQPTNYDLSFTPSKALDRLKLIDAVQDTQSVDHEYISVSDDEPYLYKNYYKLNIKVSTIDKVNEVERKSIINNIKQALFDNFNSRKVDYGYEIPVDTLYNVVLNADTRIKNVFLDDPEINTKVMLGDGVTEKGLNETYDGINKYWYLDMLARNILAGTVNKYEYLDNFEFNDTMQDTTLVEDVLTLKPTLTITTPNNTELQENQVVQLFSDSFSTSQTVTVGVNYYWYSGTSQSLKADEPYELSGTDILYISYTNSDQLIRTYKYSANAIEVYDGNGARIKYESGKTIVSPTFEITPTQNGTMDVKVGDATLKFDYLSSSEEIKFLKRNEKVFNANKYYFYWKLNNSDNVLFHENEYERILGEDEYLMYTDTSKSSVEIFSSGTKIVRDGLSAIIDKSCSIIDTSTLIDGDLSVYAGIEWVELSFDTSNTLSIKQQRILTLTNGDVVTFKNNNGGTITYKPINSTLQPFVAGDEFTYTLDGEQDTKKYNPLYNYNIRTRLDIVCGPTLPQTLKSGESILYTSTTQTSETSLLTGTQDTFITNYPIQRSGNGTIDTKLTGGQFNIITYKHYDKPEADYLQQVGEQYKIVFKNLTTSPQTFTMKVPTISGYTTKIMVYFNKESLGDTCTYTWNGTTTSLVDGVNMLSLTGTSNLVFNMTRASINSNAYILIDVIKIINGVNSAFNLSSTDETNLDNRIATLKGNIGFYETYDVPLSKIIDIDDFTKADVMFDKNNVLNKFTLCEIDFSTGGSKIDVLKSSLR